MSKNPIKDLIFVALQDSFSDSVTFHKIDDDNSIIEMDYEKITKTILESLDQEGYRIIPIVIHVIRIIIRIIVDR